MFKENKGITLVALIITIIVMLILAAVSISLVVGDNGVLTQAQKVEPSEVRSALAEAVSLANTELVSDYYTDGRVYNTEKYSNMQKILDKINKNFSYADANNGAKFADTEDIKKFASYDNSTDTAFAETNNTTIDPINIADSAKNNGRTYFYLKYTYRGEETVYVKVKISYPKGGSAKYFVLTPVDEEVKLK